MCLEACQGGRMFTSTGSFIMLVANYLLPSTDMITTDIKSSSQVPGHLEFKVQQSVKVVRTVPPHTTE